MEEIKIAVALQDFIEKEAIVGITKHKIPNKIMKKRLNLFKYIDTYEFWYDDPDNPNLNNWIDVEGIGYGWLWAQYKDSDKLQRKLVIKHAMALYKDSTNEMCVFKDDNITNILLASKDGSCIFHIRLSDCELCCQ